MIDDIVLPEANPTENEIKKENTLRPKTITEYIGQKNIITDLKTSVKAAKIRKEPLDHVLLHGSAGLGKTTLAQIIAHEMNANLKIVAAPTVEKAADLAAIVTSLQPGDILFIDEIHRLRPAIEEILYTAMEDFEIHAVMGKGIGARTMRLSVPAFTLVGATTQISLLTKPFRDRFIHEYRLEFYTPDELANIATRAAKKLNFSIDPKAAHEIAIRARGTPRVANRLLRKLRDRVTVQNNNSENLSQNQAKTWLKNLGIDERGLASIDRDYLAALDGNITHSLATLAAILGEDPNTLGEVVEPYLLRLGLIEKTGRGRRLVKI